MDKYQNSVVLSHGVGKTVTVGAALTVTVNNVGGGLATIYASNAVGANINPLTTDASGYFSFYAADGRYNIVVSGGGITPLTYNHIQ